MHTRKINGLTILEPKFRACGEGPRIFLVPVGVTRYGRVTTFLLNVFNDIHLQLIPRMLYCNWKVNGAPHKGLHPADL